METRHAKIVLDDFGYVVGVTWPIGGGVWRYKAIPQHTKTGLADSEKEALEALERTVKLTRHNDMLARYAKNLIRDIINK